MAQDDDVRLAVRLKPEDVDALDRLVAIVRRQTGPGIRVEQSDAVRYAIHVAATALATDDDGEG